MSERKIYIAVPKPPDIEIDDKITWFMERFGKMLGEEVALTAYGLIKEYSEIEITIKVTPYREVYRAGT